MEFFNIALTFPTAIFSTLLLIVIGFWLIALLGFADIDMLEGDVDVHVGESDTGSLGFGGVPLTVSLSLAIVISWFCSFYAHKFFAYLLGDGVMFYVLGIAMMLGCFFVSLLVTAILVKPLRKFFQSKEAASKSDFIGLECVIATGKVTTSFGQGKVQINGTEQLIEIRCDEDKAFSLGDIAVLIEHNDVANTYTVVEKPW